METADGVGENMPSDRALAIGLLDRVVPSASLPAEAEARASSSRAGPRGPRRGQAARPRGGAGAFRRLAAGDPFVDFWFSDDARRRIGALVEKMIREDEFVSRSSETKVSAPASRQTLRRWPNDMNSSRPASSKRSICPRRTRPGLSPGLFVRFNDARPLRDRLQDRAQRGGRRTPRRSRAGRGSSGRSIWSPARAGPASRASRRLTRSSRPWASGPAGSSAGSVGLRSRRPRS